MTEGNGRGGQVQSEKQPPDLVALRRQIIAKREGRLAAQLPWYGNNGQKMLADSDGASNGGGNGGGGYQAFRSSSDGCGVIDVSVVTDAGKAQAMAVACMTRGEHADAVVWFTHSLQLGSEESRAFISVYASRAQARQQLGLLRDAIEDYTAVLDLLDAHYDDRGDEKDKDSVAGEVIDVSNMTMARGRCRLQLEDYTAACEDFSAALRAKPSSRAASEALRDAKRLADQYERRREHEDANRRESMGSQDHVRGFVRPGLPQYENRGKSGAAF